MAHRGNGNGNGSGGRKNGGEGRDVPRWVRTLFDDYKARMDAHEARMDAHEARMAALDRAHEDHVAGMAEMKREHEARMDKLGSEQIQIRIQAGRLVKLVDDVRKGQEEARREHNLLVRFVKEVHGRVERLEGLK